MPTNLENPDREARIMEKRQSLGRPSFKTSPHYSPEERPERIKHIFDRVLVIGILLLFVLAAYLIWWFH